MVNPHTLRFAMVGNIKCNVLLYSCEYGMTHEEILKEEKTEDLDIKSWSAVLSCRCSPALSLPN